MRGSHALPRAAIPYLYRKHLTRDVQTIIIQPQNYRKWADFIWNKVNRTKLFNDVSRPPPQNRCMLTDYLIRKPIVFSVNRHSVYNFRKVVKPDIWIVHVHVKESPNKRKNALCHHISKTKSTGVKMDYFHNTHYTE